MVITGYLLSRQPRLYRSQVALLVGTSLQSSAPDASTLQASASLARMYAELVRRPLVMQAVIDGLALPQAPEKLARQVTALVQPDAQVLEIAVVDASPENAQAIADATAQALIGQTPSGQQNTQEQLAFVKAQVDELQQTIQDLEERLRNVNASLGRLSGPVEVENAQREAQALRALLDTQRSSYANLLEFYRESSSSTLTIIEPARPGTPISLHLPLSLLVAALAGTMLVSGGIYAGEQIDGALRWEEPGEVTCLGLPILGSLAGVSNRSGPLFYVRDPQGPAAQALRQVRANICLAGPSGAPHTLLITSPSRHDGKSFLASNLAVAVAAGGYNVALVDADFLAPTLPEIFDIENKEGLANLLVDERTGVESALERIIRPAGQERLWLIPGGPPPVDSALALTSPRLREMLNLLRGRFQLVIIDSPADDRGLDAGILAALSEATVLVVSPGWTSRKQALCSREAIAQRPGAHVIGVVYNRIGMPRTKARRAA